MTEILNKLNLTEFNRRSQKLPASRSFSEGWNELNEEKMNARGWMLDAEFSKLCSMGTFFQYSTTPNPKSQSSCWMLKIE
jgi:hypothetical protein